MIPPLMELLQPRWPQLRPAKVTLVFFDWAGDLAAVAKVARSPASEPALVQEYETLSHLWALGVPSVRERVAEPLLLERVAGRLALVQAPLRGRPMTAAYYTPGHVTQRAPVAKDFARAAAWLLAFQRETATGLEVLDAALLDRWVGQVIRSYREEVGWTAIEEKLFGEVQTRAEALIGLPLPTAAVHGDFWMGNLLVDESGLRGVVDWERGRSSGPCPLDVYKFPTSYAVYMDRAYPGGVVPGHPGREHWRERWRRFGEWPNLAGFGYAYWGEGWFPDLVRGFILGHLDALGIPVEANAVFFPLFLAEQALLPGHPRTRAANRALLHAFAEEPTATWLRR